MQTHESSSGPRRATHRIELRGDVDLGRRDELDTLAQWFEADACPDVSLDLSRVTFLDSTGLSFMLRLRNVADARGGRAEVLDAPACVRRLLRLVNLDGRFLLSYTKFGTCDRTRTTPREPVA
jgi:anti-sigma B factor antagonist